MRKLRKPILPRQAQGQPAQPKPPKLDALAQINQHAAGLDIGDVEIYAAVPENAADPAVRVFRTFTADLESLADWLTACHVDTVAMESTGVYWIPIYELLEERGFQVYLVNARQLKNVSGKKTDILDCQWIQQLHTLRLRSGQALRSAATVVPTAGGDLRPARLDPPPGQPAAQLRRRNPAHAEGLAADEPQADQRAQRHHRTDRLGDHP
jgi:hypothetical protein